MFIFIIIITIIINNLFGLIVIDRYNFRYIDTLSYINSNNNIFLRYYIFVVDDDDMEDDE